MQADAPATATHKPTGKRCTVIVVEVTTDRFFCNFGEVVGPFTWVPRADLTFDPQLKAEHE